LETLVKKKIEIVPEIVSGTEFRDTFLLWASGGGLAD
jgi:hypothetical protein